jgi:negative regulator of flagellin synthesis FlgM
MRVDQSTSNQVQSSEAQGAKHAKKTHGTKHADSAEGASEARGHAPAANAEVSDRAREMATARAAANDAPDVREDKIAELKARISGGRYNVDSHAVADRMVDDHIRMSGIG